MSAEDERRRARAELEAEFQRLDTVFEVLADMQDAAFAVAWSKDLRGVGFENSRHAQAFASLRPVHVERSEVRDRLLDYQFTPSGPPRSALASPNDSVSAKPHGSVRGGRDEQVPGSGR